MVILLIKNAIDSPSLNPLKDNFLMFLSTDKNRHYFLKRSGILSSGQKAHDSSAIMKENNSLSPIYLHPVNHNEDELYESADFMRK